MRENIPSKTKFNIKNAKHVRNNCHIPYYSLNEKQNKLNYYYKAGNLK